MSCLHLFYYPYCVLWHLKNKSIIHASASHYSSFASYASWFGILTHTQSRKSHIVSWEWAHYRWWFLVAIMLVCQLCGKLIVRFSVVCTLVYIGRRRQQRTRIEAQIFSAARLMKICSEDADRQCSTQGCVIMPGCNGRAYRPALLSVHLTHVIPLCLQSFCCLSNSVAPSLSLVPPPLQLHAFQTFSLTQHALLWCVVFL